MPLCLQIIGTAIQVMTPQPADISTCAYVMASGAEFLGPFMPLFDIPSSADLATAFSIGVMTPLFGWFIAVTIRPLVHFFKE